METKICKLCNVEKPVDELYINCYKTYGDGKYYTAECKLCRNPIEREYYQNNKERINARRREKMTCVCGSVVSKDAIYRHKKSQQHLNTIN